jgi:hypothetical protein
MDDMLGIRGQRKVDTRKTIDCSTRPRYNLSPTPTPSKIFWSKLCWHSVFQHRSSLKENIGVHFNLLTECIGFFHPLDTMQMHFIFLRVGKCQRSHWIYTQTVIHYWLVRKITMVICHLNNTKYTQCLTWKLESVIQASGSSWRLSGLIRFFTMTL